MATPRLTRDEAREAALDHAVRLLRPHFQNVCVIASDVDLDETAQSDDGMSTRMGCRMTGDVAAVYGLTEIMHNMAGAKIQSVMEADDEESDTDGPVG